VQRVVKHAGQYALLCFQIYIRNSARVAVLPCQYEVGPGGMGGLVKTVSGLEGLEDLRPQVTA
jgi:hypothetical protein